MYLKTFTASIAVILTGILFSGNVAIAQDDTIVRFDSSIDAPGVYVGETDEGEVGVLVVETIRDKRGREAKIKGELIVRGFSQTVSGTVVNTPVGRAVYYPVHGQQLGSLAGDSAGGDYELSGARGDIYEETAADGKITSFWYNGSTYEWDPEDRSYRNPRGFDKFQFWPNGDGTYRYEHTYKSWGGGGGTHSTGTASPSAG
ncbi:MAG: hypothetical protein AAF456_03380 [Planctomycetota bacterium]